MYRILQRASSRGGLLNPGLWTAKVPLWQAPFQRFYTSKTPDLKTIWTERLKKVDALFLTGVTRFHEITGYSEIEKMKRELLDLETKVNETRKKVRDARELYNERLSQRSNSQSEMNELLMRKQTWLPNDLERFTQLYKDDHQIQLGVTEAKQQYSAVETELEELQQLSGKLIGARYREEQLWSDKIRQASTWGTWVLMGINILLFIVVQLVLEPWKRSRLVRAFEAKVGTMLDERSNGYSRDIKQPASKQEETERQLDAINPDSDGIVSSANPNAGSQPLQWSTLINRITTKDYHLQPVVQLRPVEIGALALGTGAALAGVLGAVISLCRY